MKELFFTHEKLEKIINQHNTPFHLCDETGIRSNAVNLNKAFNWNTGFKEYFAVKAMPNPVILQILKEEIDCSSMTELMIVEAVGFSGREIMFSQWGIMIMESFGRLNRCFVKTAR